MTPVPGVPTPFWTLWVPGTHRAQTSVLYIYIYKRQNVYFSKLVLDKDLLDAFSDGGFCWVTCYIDKSDSASVQQWA